MKITDIPSGMIATWAALAVLLSALSFGEGYIIGRRVRFDYMADTGCELKMIWHRIDFLEDEVKDIRSEVMWSARMDSLSMGSRTITNNYFMQHEKKD